MKIDYKFTHNDLSDLIPESKKDANWVMMKANYYIAELTSRNALKDSDTESYNQFYGQRDLRKYDYVTRTFGMDFPAKLRHIPLIKPLCDVLLGEELKRSLNFTPLASDNESIEFKEKEIHEQTYLSLSQSSLDSLYTKFENIANGRADDNKLLPRLGDLYKRKIEETENYFRNNFSTAQEKNAKKALNWCVQTMNLKKKFNRMFLHQLVSGKQYYKCKFFDYDCEPEFRVVDPRNLAYPNEDDVEFINQCEWVVEKVRMSSGQIINKWGHLMTEEERRNLETYSYVNAGDKIDSPQELETTGGTNSSKITHDKLYSGSAYTKAIDVYIGEFKSNRKIRVKISKNKYDEESPFYKILPEDYKEKDKEKYETRYTQDLYEFVRIGDDIFPIAGKAEFALRDVTNKRRVLLSYNGFVYDPVLNPAYSIVDATKHLQDLYDILHFYIENLIATSGAKGMVIPLNLIPSSWTLEDVLYYKKLGILFVEYNEENGATGFNQFKDYDDSPSNGILNIFNIIQGIEEQAHRITGVSRQRTGAISQYDGKETTNQAILQSNLNTEVLFYEHEKLIEKALEDIINTCKYAWKTNKRGQYVLGNTGNEVFTLDANGWQLADYLIFMESSSKNERKLQEMKNLAMQLTTSQQIDSLQLFKMFGMESVNELTRYIEDSLYLNEKNRQEANKAAQETEQRKQELELMKTESEVKKNKDSGEAALITAYAKAKEVDSSITIKQKEIDLKTDVDLGKLEVEKEDLELDKQRLALEASMKKNLKDNK